MYVGRIVAVGRTRGGANAGLYRVSSRSFPNRQVVEIGGRLAVIPREGHEADVHKNPYIAYNCLRIAGDWCVIANGSHTDPIAEKIEAGVPPRDALVASLLALDYERDDYDTPRIAGAVEREGDTAWLGIVRRDGLLVRSFALRAGRALWIATYEANEPRGDREVEFDAGDAAAAARQLIDGPGFADLTNPVTSAAALSHGRGFDLASQVI